MRILYGVQGTGNGHIARARAMAAAFKQHPDVDVDFLFSGRCPSKYFSMESFGGYQTRRGITFATHQGAVDLLKTVTDNNLFQFHRETQKLDLDAYDLVLNDFEPVSAWAAKKQDKPCISISHQNAFRYDVPLQGAGVIDKMILKYFAPSDKHIGLHWYHFDQPLLPPIVHSDLPSPLISDECSKGFSLVYLPFESLDAITELLIHFPQQHFVCYHPQIMEPETIENIDWHPLSCEGFQLHLHQCDGVIANGGFELPSESLSLGKKLLVKPLHGQFEQASNAATLETLGLGSVMEVLDPAIVRKWLSEPMGERVKYPNVAQAIVDWVVAGKWEDVASLSQSLWDQVEFPECVTLELDGQLQFNLPSQRSIKAV